MIKKFNALIVDDEPLIVAQLEDFLAQTQLFEKPFVSETGTDALSQLHNQSIDLLFLDIELPDMNGLDFLRSFPNHPPTVVISAHPRYAIDSYDCDVCDFLPKPFNYTRFLRSVRRTVLRATNPTGEQKEKTDYTGEVPGEDSPTHIYLKTGHINQRFALSEILYLEASNIYTKIVTPADTTVVSEQISNLEERLGGDCFLRVHKSYVVNVEHVTRYSAKSIWLQHHTVPIGRKYQAEVKDRLPKATRNG